MFAENQQNNATNDNQPIVQEPAVEEPKKTMWEKVFGKKTQPEPSSSVSTSVEQPQKKGWLWGGKRKGGYNYKKSKKMSKKGGKNSKKNKTKKSKK